MTPGSLGRQQILDDVIYYQANYIVDSSDLKPQFKLISISNAKQILMIISNLKLKIICQQQQLFFNKLIYKENYNNSLTIYGIYHININFRMGLQQSCLSRANTEEEPPKIKSILNSSGLTKSQPYPLSHQVGLIHQQLLSQFNNNQYLDIIYSPQNVKGVTQREGYYKLSIYEACYHGEWKNQKPHGRGTAVFPNGSLLIGIFIEGYCEGDKNYFIYADGSHYVGSIKTNKMAGKGKLTNSNVVYDGSWLDNLPHGEGIEEFLNGDRYIGMFEMGLKHGGEELFIWHDDNRYLQYKGGFKKGKICGEGTLIMRNKTTIHGIFDEISINKCVFSSNHYNFTGNYSNGKFNGEGKIQFVLTHETYEGNFKQGRLQGQCKIKDAKQRNVDAFCYNNYLLKKVSGLKDDQIKRIIRVIQSAYASTMKHSNAIVEISQDLTEDYECRYIEPFENIFKNHNYLIASIYDKILLVKAKKHNL